MAAEGRIKERIQNPQGNVILEAAHYPIYHGSSQDNTGFRKSQITKMYYTYPVKLLVPELASANYCTWLYLLTYGGGLVGGDSIKLEIEARNNTCALLTTQASTKVYYCEEDMTTKQEMQYTILPYALISVIPDPVVCYKDANYMQTQTVHMSSDSNLLFIDWLTAGRMARGELWEFTRYMSTTTIYINEHLAFKDSLHLENTSSLSVAEAMGAYQVIGICIILGKLFNKHTDYLLHTLGKPKAIDSTYPNDCVFSISPLLYPKCENISGCMIKFMANTTSLAYEELDRTILTPLYPLLGGNPFENKY